MFVVAFALALSVLSWRRYRAGVVEARELAATQQALRTSQAEAEHANQAKSLFLANVSHELRTPLTSLIGTNELLQDTELNPEQGRFVKIMDRAGQRLLALVTDILDFSKLEAGTLRLRTVPLNLGILTYDVVALMRPAAQAKGLPIEHRLSCEPDVPETLVGDPERIAQVLTTLLDNAIKFSTSGVIRLTTSVSTDAPESARVVFAVSDEGIGIPEESHGRLFEAFSQLDASMTREHTGTGLGLAICADLVRMMDGSIKVESSPGEGSTFTVELPLVASSVPPVRLDGGPPPHRPKPISSTAGSATARWTPCPRAGTGAPPKTGCTATGTAHPGPRDPAPQRARTAWVPTARATTAPRWVSSASVEPIRPPTPTHRARQVSVSPGSAARTYWMLRCTCGAAVPSGRRACTAHPVVVSRMEARNRRARFRHRCSARVRISLNHALDFVDADVAKTQKRGERSRRRTLGVRVAGSAPGLVHGPRLSRCRLAAPLLRDGLAGERFQELRGHPVGRHRVTLEDGIRDLTH